MMEIDKNRSGDSGVRAFEIGEDFIVVEFLDLAVYRYTRASAGAANIEQMKRLAESGKGLATFINRHVRKRYEARLK